MFLSDDSFSSKDALEDARDKFCHEVRLVRSSLLCAFCRSLPRPWDMAYDKSEKSSADILVISSIVNGRLFITPSRCIRALMVSRGIDTSFSGCPQTLLHMYRVVDLPLPDLRKMTLMIAPFSPMNLSRGEPNAVNAANALGSRPGLLYRLKTSFHLSNVPTGFIHCAIPLVCIDGGL